MKGIKNIIYDFDGTLADTAPLILQTMNATIAELGLAVRTDKECRATIGLRLEDIPAALWPGAEGLSQKYAATYRRIFEELKRPFSVECFPSVEDTLRELHCHGFRQAIASSRSRRSLEEYVGMFGLNDCFSVLVGGNDVAHGKPAPDPVFAILEAMKWSAATTLVVGDAPVDILMGKAAGTKTCAVTYGNSNRAALEAAQPDYIIDSFEQLKDLL